MSKKILIITDNKKEQINGVVTTFSNIEVHALQCGHTFDYICPGNFKHCGAPRYPEVKLSWPWRIGRLIQEKQPDHIHIATEGPIGLWGRIACDKLGWRYNTSYHTRFPDFMQAIYGIPPSLTWTYLRWFHRHSGVVLTTTPTMVDDLRAHGFRGTIRPWTRGVDRTALSATVPHSDRYLPLPVRVLYVGRVSREKNLDALCQLQDQYQIEIVGDGPYRSYLEKHYPKVEFLGYQTGTELANSYTRADVFAFPSRADTFGIVMIEALSLGTPVAAYAVPGPIDIVEPGITGHLGENLAHSIDIAAKLDRKRVKQASQRWTWEQCWRIFEENLVPVRG